MHGCGRRVERVDRIRDRDRHRRADAGNRPTDVAVGERLAIVGNRHQRAIDGDQLVAFHRESEVGAALLDGVTA
jgi:hypothetical protein